MELYGSLSNISGSVSASYFTGSYIGDGAGLYNLPASGVTGLNLSQIASGSVTASVTPNGFNVNTSTSITGSLNVSGTVLSQTTPLVSGSSQINITGTTGYSTFSSSIATTDSNQESRLNSIETSTGSLNSFTSSTNNKLIAVETSTGSLNSFTSSINTTIKNKLNTDGVISGSSQILNGSNIVSSSTQVVNYGFATTGSNIFIGTQTHSGSIIPSVDNAYDLGSSTHQWRDVYISSGSLYVDNTKVLSSTAQELTITTDNGQSIKILESTTDSIILQTADGDIELKSSADGDILLDPTNGKIMLKGPVEILNGNKIQSSVNGTPVVFANDIIVSGSIDITGTIEGIDLTAFSSSVNGRLSSLESSGGSLNTFTASAISRLNSLENTTSSLNTFTSSNNTRLGVIESTTSSINTFTSSASGRLNSIETSTSSLNSFTSSASGRLTSIESTTASIITTNSTQDTRLTSLEGKTGSYATTGSNIFIGNQTITGSLYVSQDLIIAGSSSIQHISSSVVNIADNIITVNAQNPSIRFGGLAVIDSGSSPQVSGSMLFDSVNNQWIFVHQNQAQVTSSVLLMGPETYNNLGGESYITANRLVKSTGIEHLAASNISDDGTTVTILSNAVINGTFSATGTTIVSGSSQINHNSTTNYVANEHINHTSVSISAGNGLSGGGDISATRTLSLDTTSVTFTNGVKTKMNTDGVVSGSSQITYGGISGIPSGIVSGSSQVSYPSLSNIPSGIVSGSSQVSFTGLINIPSGLVSGSSQIDLTATTNYSSGIKTRLNAEGVLSGSAQVVAALPAGTVSGSSQITYGNISGIPSGIVSGSSQISFGSISGVPSGLVSGSSQITLSSTSGFGSYLNQAVLTSSAPTFAGITSSGPVTITGNGSYLGDWGYKTLELNDTSGYPGIFFRNSGNIWLLRRNGADNGFDFAYSTNATAQGTGTFTQQGKWTAAGDLYVRGQIYVGGNGSSTGTQLVYNSGTWGINISGNAATATTAGALTSMNISQFTNNSGYITGVTNISGYANNLYSQDIRTLAPNSHSTYRLNFGFTSFNNNNTSPWADYLHLRSYSDSSGGADNLLVFSKSSIAIRLYQQTWNSATAYSSYKDIAFTDGSNASGTWGISISGNAATAGGFTPTQSSGTANRIVVADANGYIINNYFNASGGGAERNASGMGYFAGHNTSDYYYRSYTAAAAAALLSGQAMNISGNATTASSTGTLSSNAVTNGYLVIGGNYSNNAYNSVAGGTRLMFGGGDADAQGNYYIGTNMENYGGNYNKLDLRWHTGIRMGAQPSYGGIRFFDTEDLGTVLFSIGASDGNVRSHTNLLPSANNSYNLGNSSLRWANLYTNDLHLSNEGKEGGNEIDGTTGDWTIQEGQENLYIINNKNGKKFKIDLTEIV